MIFKYILFYFISHQVCQKADFYYNCGEYENPVFILYRYNPYYFRIEYPNGFQWRISIFEFIEDKNHPDTTITFLQERPNLQYNFVVTGKCIGQPSCETGRPDNH